MTFKVWHKCSCGCDERHFITLKILSFSFRWFMDNGDWFIHVKAGRYHYRFSSAGYINYTKSKYYTKKK